MLLLLLNNWRVVLFGMTVLVLGTAAGYYKWQANRWESKYEDFVVETRAAGLAAEILAKETKARDAKAKEVADANYRKSLNSLRDTVARLRDSRSSSQYLPAPTPAAPSSDRITFQRAELESAIRRLDAGLSEIAGKCDEQRSALDTAKVWASGRIAGQ